MGIDSALESVLAKVMNVKLTRGERHCTPDTIKKRGD